MLFVSSLALVAVVKLVGQRATAARRPRTECVLYLLVLVLFPAIYLLDLGVLRLLLLGFLAVVLVYYTVGVVPVQVLVAALLDAFEVVVVYFVQLIAYDTAIGVRLMLFLKFLGVLIRFALFLTNCLQFGFLVRLFDSVI